LLAGRKLLLADDSVAVQKVIDLTFTDEGMHVIAVSDGRLALEQLEQIEPDVVLADIFMPRVGGYELCEFIKQSERFSRVPVMLLVGSFEPFDEADAKRAGADDVVTKPFQSIRDLVSRVGSLLSGQGQEAEPAAHDYSTLGLSQTEMPTEQLEQQPPEPMVFVEAAKMSDELAVADEPLTIAPGAESAAVSAEETGPVATPPDPAMLELQTADTQKLQPVEGTPTAELATENQEDTIEIEPVIDAPPNVKAVQAEPMIGVPRIEAETITESAADRQDATIGVPPIEEQTITESAAGRQDVLSDSVLDLGSDLKPTAVDEDFFLDLDLEEPVPEPSVTHEMVAIEAPAQTETVAVSEPSQVFEPMAATQEWTISAEEPPAEETPPLAVAEPLAETPARTADAGLSAEAIDAIARRVVEQLSDRVVREIAWEVVPELAELLIKQKLQEQK
jgi:CheY-like chemotaxis protein